VVGRLRQFTTSRRALLLAPLLLFTTLLSWALSSPVGSSPDEDFHLVSIWCATGDVDACIHEESATEATVPGALLDVACYAFDDNLSGECQDELDFRGAPDSVTERGNFYGAYPAGFYTAMSLFVGPDIELSVLAMRIVVVLVFTGLATALFLLLSPHRRPTLVWSWIVTTVPVGLFVLSSINPSTWSIAGVGLGWLALAGFLESSGARKVGLGVLFALAVAMAVVSRGDASMYMALAILATLVLYARRTRQFAGNAILPVAAIVACALMFRVSRPVEHVTQGVEPELGISAVLARVVPTIFDVPRLWMGAFGHGYGLGWLDTAMPAVVGLGSLACFLGAAIVALSGVNVRKTVVLIGGIVVLWALPTAVLVAAGEDVGANMQPRYLLPLLVLFAGVLFWSPPGRPIRFGRAQRILVVVTLGVAQSIALHLNLSRYVSGFDDLAPHLDSGVEWWWPIAVSPMAVWVVGSIAYAGLVALLLGGAAGQESVSRSEPAREEPDLREVSR
jgi:hypothetical protein